MAVLREGAKTQLATAECLPDCQAYAAQAVSSGQAVGRVTPAHGSSSFSFCSAGCRSEIKVWAGLLLP